LVVLAGVVLFVIFGAGEVLLAGLTVATLVVSAFEKFAYQKSMAAYESLIRKLANRVETLEGVALTPMVPSDAAPGVRVADATKRRAS
jgi:hypothetical protein